MRHYIGPDESNLNPQPSVSALAMLARHQRNGTTPGNPKGYRPQAFKPFQFIENQPPRYPHRLFTTIGNEQHRADVFERFMRSSGLRSTPKEYVKAWDKVNGFKHAPIRWVKALHFG